MYRRLHINFKSWTLHTYCIYTQLFIHCLYSIYRDVCTWNLLNSGNPPKVQKQVYKLTLTFVNSSGHVTSRRPKANKQHLIKKSKTIPLLSEITQEYHFTNNAANQSNKTTHQRTSHQGSTVCGRQKPKTSKHWKRPKFKHKWRVHKIK